MGDGGEVGVNKGERLLYVREMREGVRGWDGMGMAADSGPNLGQPARLSYLVQPLVRPFEANNFNWMAPPE